MIQRMEARQSLVQQRMESDLKQLAARSQDAICFPSQIQYRTRRQTSSEVLGLVPPPDHFIKIPRNRQTFDKTERPDPAEKKNV